jgi:hypothetical protein
MDFQNDDYFSFLSPWLEPSQYHWDWPISNPLVGETAASSYTHLPQASEVPRDREVVGLPGF